MEKNKSLEVIFSTSDERLLTRRDIYNHALNYAIKWVRFWLVMSIGFCTSTVLSLILCAFTQAKWYVWLIFVFLLGVLGAVFTYIYTRMVKSKNALSRILPENIVINIIVCIDKKRTDFANDNEVIYTLLTDQGEYLIRSDAYKNISIGDKLALVDIAGVILAYPLICWSIEGIEECGTQLQAEPEAPTTSPIDAWKNKW